MNIFFLSRDPSLAATWLVDRHVIKMVTEYAQILGTAHRLLHDRPGIWDDGVVRLALPGEYDCNGDARRSRQVAPLATHTGHPCVRWVLESPANYKWLLELYRATARTYQRRYNRQHASYTRWIEHLSEYPEYKSFATLGDPITPPALAMPDEYKFPVPPDASIEVQTLTAVLSYRRHYRLGKSHLHAWRIPGHRPAWIDSSAPAERSSAPAPAPATLYPAAPFAPLGALCSASSAVPRGRYRPLTRRPPTGAAVAPEVHQRRPLCSRLTVSEFCRRQGSSHD